MKSGDDRLESPEHFISLEVLDKIGCDEAVSTRYAPINPYSPADKVSKMYVERVNDVIRHLTGYESCIEWEIYPVVQCAGKKIQPAGRKVKMGEYRLVRYGIAQNRMLRSASEMPDRAET